MNQKNKKIKVTRNVIEALPRSIKERFCKDYILIKGKLLPLKKWKECSDKRMNELCEQFSELLELELNEPRTNHLVQTDKQSFAMKAREDEIRKYCKDNGLTIERIVPKRGNHICGYCGNITTGSDDDILCAECHEVFGHYLYSEL